MILSEWILDVNSLLEKKIINEYSLHQRMYDVFPNIEKRCFLYCAKYSYEHSLKVIIQSEEKPIPPSYGEFRSKEINDSYFLHNKYLFQSKFCPVKQKSNLKTVIPLKKEEEVFSWLKKRESNYGVSFQMSSLMRTGCGSIKMKQKNNSETIKIDYVEITGVLSVENHDLFKSMISNGIGRSKGFGLGMIQIKPIE